MISFQKHVLGNKIHPQICIFLIYYWLNYKLIVHVKQKYMSILWTKTKMIGRIFWLGQVYKIRQWRTTYCMELEENSIWYMKPERTHILCSKACGPWPRTVENNLPLVTGGRMAKQFTYHIREFYYISWQHLNNNSFIYSGNWWIQQM